jgi:hypothetical protein
VDGVNVSIIKCEVFVSHGPFSSSSFQFSICHDKTFWKRGPRCFYL